MKNETYEVRTSGYKDYIAIYRGEALIAYIPTREHSCDGIRDGLIEMMQQANKAIGLEGDLMSLNGLQPWIGDRQMKEKFNSVMQKHFQ